jgi:hypothetical protein
MLYAWYKSDKSLLLSQEFNLILFDVGLFVYYKTVFMKSSQDSEASKLDLG